MKSPLLFVTIGLTLLGLSEHASGREEPPKKKPVEKGTFPGLLSELRKADLVVKVTLTGSKLADEIATIDGTITAVYQGKVKAGQAIQFQVDRAALATKQERYGDFGHLYYFYNPPWKKDATGIFLIKAGKPLQGTAILADTELVGDYVKVARLADADAAIGLVKLMCRLAYDKKTSGWYPYDYPHIVLQDLAVNFKHLKTRSDGFRALLADHRKDALTALKESHMFAFSLAVWLTAHMEKEHRGAGLTVLLARYEENEKIIAKLEEEAKKAGKAEKQPGVGPGIYISPLTQHQGLRGVYLGAMDLIESPAWTSNIPQSQYDVMPAPSHFTNKRTAEDVLKAARAMVK